MGTGGMTVGARLGSAALYSPGAFYFNPLKGLLQYAVGDSYDVGYKYFIRDHSEPNNLALHMIALVWQLVGNFGLLACADKALGVTFIAPVTALIWIATLFAGGAPLRTALPSAACIALACVTAPAMDARVVEVSLTAAFIACSALAALVENAVSSKPRFGLWRALRISVPWMGGLVAVREVAALMGKDVLKGSTLPASILLIAVSMAGGMQQKPTKPMNWVGVGVSRVLGELSGQTWMIWLGQQAMAGISQGVAHKVTLQASTLGSHEQNDAEDRMTKLGYECSHVVYFPALCINAVLDSIDSAMGGKPLYIAPPCAENAIEVES